MSKLRVGVDLDSVVYNTDRSWTEFYTDQWRTGKCSHNNYGVIFADAVTTSWDFHSAICKPCFLKCLHDKDRIFALKFNEGAKNALWEIFNYADMWAITSRPEQVHHHTIAQLERDGIYNLFEKVIFTQDKAQTAQEFELDYHIEDAPRHIEALSYTSTQTLIFDHKYNEGLVGMRFFKWEEILKYLEAQHTIHEFVERSYAEEDD